jgi:hypothetical protein
MLLFEHVGFLLYICLVETAIFSHFYYLFLFNNSDFTSFSGVIPEGKHVMLSYHWKNQDIVSKIGQRLRDKNVSVWFNEQRDMYNIYDR